MTFTDLSGIILWTIQIIIGFNLIFPLILYIWWKLKSPKSRVKPVTIQEKDFAVIVTAYEQTSFIPKVVESILKVNYSNYLVYIVADKCTPNPDLNFNDERVNVLFPPEVIASNTGSHFYAINNFIREHEVLMIVDSDNLLDSDIVKELNTSLSSGFEAVQGIREAKNLDTNFACLDAARDIYYHFYDGKILFQVGSSATLAGSGMAFSTILYRQSLEHLDIKGAGFDKVLQAQILKAGKRIAFNEKAIIYDEKTSKSDQLVNQRSRWINTWFRYFKFGFGIIGRGIINFNINQFVFGLITLRPPLFIFLLLSCLCMFINLFFYPLVSLAWLIALLLFVTGFIIALKSNPTDKRIYQALRSIPKFIFFQLISLTKAASANKRSVATKHQFKEQ